MYRAVLRIARGTGAARSAAANAHAVSPFTARRTWVRDKSGLDADESHPDFQAVSKAPAGDSSVHEFIAQDVSQNAILVYMKGTPTAPQCGFSNMVCRILDGHGVQYASRNVLEDADLRQGIKTFTHWPTIPQVFIGGEFVGGSDILMSMHSSGELAQSLQKLKQRGETTS